MPLRLWNQDLIGNRVPTSHSFSLAIQRYRAFRQEVPNLDPLNNDDLDNFARWLVNTQGLAPGGADAVLYPFGENQLDIAKITDTDVIELAEVPEGRTARIFLHKWYRCNVLNELPRCIADVFIVGKLRQLGLNGGNLNENIQTLEFAGTENAATALITVGNGIGRHFGFLGDDGGPTHFFHSYFQETY